MEIRKAFKYRCYPNQAQQAQLDRILWLCRNLYNAGLQERREAYRLAHKTLSCYEQINELPALKEVDPEYKQVPSHVLQDVLQRLDKAFAAFFRRVKAGQPPGFPRFQGRGRFNSFTYPDSAGWKLIAGRLVLTGIGDVNVRFHRPIEGTIKTLTVRRDGDYWYVCFSCVVQVQPLPANEAAVGIDLGLLHFATLSTGEQIANPRFLRRAAKRLQAAQQKLSRGQKGSNRRAKAKHRMARQHRKIRNQRHDFLHKQARQLVNRYGTLVFENLTIANLSRRPVAQADPTKTAEAGAPVYAPNGAAAKAGLNKSISDAGWRTFQQYCDAKAAWAGRHVLYVDPRFTSQICSQCGVIQKKALSERWHSCPACGAELDRDHNAARNILAAGKRLGVETPASQV